jgi:hypothetical protein
MNGWTWPAAVAVTMPLLVTPVPASGETPPAQPLEAYVFDASAWPTVLIDVVVPRKYATSLVEPAQIELDGGRVESVAPVDAIDSVVSVVIDDSPKVPAEVVYNAQGASVELVRNVDEGTAIALSTPSGMQTEPTSDQGASLSRINGISAGAPDVLPLNRLVLDAARVLVGTAWPDRHLVLAVGRPVSENPTLRELSDIVERANIRLHVVADPGIETGAIASLAEETGGVAGQGETMLADMDAVTAAIVHRVRVVATVDGPGPLPLALTLDGERFTTEVDVPAAPPARSPSTDTSPSGSVAGAPAPTVAPETVAPETATPATAAGSATGQIEASRRGPLLIAALLVTAGVVAVAWLWSRARRRAATSPAPTPQPAAAAPPPVPDPVLAPTPEPSVAAGPAEPEPADFPAADPLPAEWRRPAERPHRATPRRRPAPSASPLPEEEESPQEEPASEDEWLVVGRIRLNRRTGHVYAATRRISLTPSEFAVLQLLMTRGGHGVTRDAILAASTAGTDSDDVPDPDAVLAELRRKTGIRGRGQGVRQERALVYFFGQ